MNSGHEPGSTYGETQHNTAFSTSPLPVTFDRATRKRWLACRVVNRATQDHCAACVMHATGAAAGRSEESPACFVLSARCFVQICVADGIGRGVEMEAARSTPKIRLSTRRGAGKRKPLAVEGKTSQYPCCHVRMKSSHINKDTA
jgi:hypothetical protein